MNGRELNANMLNAAAGLLVLLIIGLALRQMAALLAPFLVAFGFYCLTAPVFDYLVARRVPRPLAYSAPPLLVGAVLALIAWLLGSQLVPLRERWPTYREKSEERISSLLERLPPVKRHIGNVLSGRPESSPSLETLAGMLGSFVESMSASVLIIVYLLFLFAESFTMPDRLAEAFGRERSLKVLRVGARIKRSLIRYTYVKSVTSALIAVPSIALMLGFSLEFAALWGFLIFIGNFIPYFGSAITLLPPIALAAIQLPAAATLLLSASLIVCHLAVAYGVEPNFTGHQLDLSPIMVIIALAFWGWLWGILGLLLAVPITAALKLMLEEAPSLRFAAILMSSKVTHPREES